MSFLVTGRQRLRRFTSSAALLLMALLLAPRASLQRAVSSPPRTSSLTHVEGVVVSTSGPVPGGEVHAYATFADLIAGRHPIVSKPTINPGFFQLELPPGKYYLLARAAAGGEHLVGYHGANPIRVKGADLWLPLMVVPKRTEQAVASTTPHVAGIVTYKGKPVVGAQVSLYSVREGPFKGMGLSSGRTGSDGSFKLSVQDGKYLVIARKRGGGRRIKPLKKGDLYCYYPSNPVELEPSTRVAIELPCYPKQDVKAFVDEAALPAVKRTRATAARLRELLKEPDGQAEIQGRIVDPSGRPAAGLFVMGYEATKPHLFQMHMLRDKPTLLGKTASDGSFLLKVATPGDYILVARGQAGGAPVPSELFGLFEGNVGHTVSVRAGATVQAPIVVSRVMDGATAAPRAQPEPLADEQRLVGEVISSDTTWRGRVTIRGQLLVARGATLTVLAGTQVRFERVDENGDGVGDGELRVLGRLLVRGKPGAPVRFSSAATQPRAKDWSYVLLFTTREESHVQHAIFEHAFTGMQAHFSKATIRDSVFHNNVEGIRFGRAEIAIEHNEIRDNQRGIRQHRIEDPITIVGNEIANNDVGIFLVPSGQNTIGFSAKRYAIGKQQRTQPLVRLNNISSNRRHNYRLGERFAYDIEVSDNWWGSSAREKISKGIFDHEDDPALGRVLIEPFRTSPVPGTGPRAVTP